MRFLVFQHHPAEHPGIFRDFLAADGIAWDAVELNAGEEIPDLAPYDALLVMGGPMDVWQEEAHPWLRAEKAAIARSVRELERPYLGLCLGHQLLADALGGKVGPMAQGEIGICEVALSESGRQDPLLGGSEDAIKALQWHSAEVKVLPEGAVALAHSDVSSNQAIRVGKNAYGLQYHLEVEADTVRNWGEIEEYRKALESSLGPGALEPLDEETAACLPGFNAAARRLYDAFLRLL